MASCLGMKLNLSVKISTNNNNFFERYSDSGLVSVLSSTIILDLIGDDFKYDDRNSQCLQDGSCYKLGHRNNSRSVIKLSRHEKLN